MISIIVPIYNVGEKISNLLNILNNFSENEKKIFELIFINDGSELNEKEIIDKLLFSKYKFINKKNGGLNSARYEGIKAASRNYIWFVDPDDYILFKHNELDSLIEIIKKYNPDIIGMNYFEKDVVKNKCKKINVFSKNFYINNIQSINKTINKKIGFRNCSMCTKIFKKSFIEKMDFTRNIYHEDTLMWFQILLEKISYYHLSISPYVYCFYNGSSSITEKLKNNLDENISTMLYLYKIIFNSYDRYNKFFKKCLNMYVYSDLYSVRRNNEDLFNKYKIKIKKIYKKNNINFNKFYFFKFKYYFRYLIKKFFLI